MRDPLLGMTDKQLISTTLLGPCVLSEPVSDTLAGTAPIEEVDSSHFSSTDHGPTSPDGRECSGQFLGSGHRELKENRALPLLKENPALPLNPKPKTSAVCRSSHGTQGFRFRYTSGRGLPDCGCAATC